MAVRETRSSWRRLLFFFVCIAVGVAAIVALRSVIQSVRDVFGARSRARSSRPTWSLAPTATGRPTRAQTIDRRLAEAGATVADRDARDADDGAAGGRAGWSRGWWSCAPCSRSFRSTARLTLQGGQPYSHALLEDHGALVRPELLTALGAQSRRSDRDRTDDVHDPRRHREGAGRRVGGFSLGPRVLIDFADVPATGAAQRSAAAPAGRFWSKVPDARRSSRSSGRCARDFRQDFINTRSYRAHGRPDRPATSTAPRTT